MVGWTGGMWVFCKNREFVFVWVFVVDMYLCSHLSIDSSCGLKAMQMCESFCLYWVYSLGSLR